MRKCFLGVIFSNIYSMLTLGVGKHEWELNARWNMLTSIFLIQRNYLVCAARYQHAGIGNANWSGWVKGKNAKPRQMTDKNIRLSTTKSLFPVQRVAVIMASRAAAIFCFIPFVFFLYENIVHCWKKNFFFAKIKKKVRSWPFFRHPAAPSETEFFFRLA